jgi:Ulp1 family protease
MQENPDAKENPAEKIPGCHAKLPIQQNNCDCGVFILQYIEEIIRDFPKKVPIMREDWFNPEAIMKKRQDIRSKICALHAEQSGSSQPQ